jgi:hypothetical protein
LAGLVRGRDETRLVEVGIVARGVLEPEFEISRQSGLVQRANLAECDFRKREGPFVLVLAHGLGARP